MALFRRIIIWCRVSFYFFRTIKGVRASIYTAEETINVLKSGKSLIRFGDGEFGIFRNHDIHYQPCSPELKEYFQKIKNEYEFNCENCKYLLAVPRHFMTVNGFVLAKKRVYVSSWSEARYDFKNNFRHDIPYGDAFLFEKNNRSLYSSLWMNEHCPANVIFVHNSEKYAEDFRQTYNKNVIFVQCPSYDAFSVINDLEKKIFDVIHVSGWSEQEVMITISAGPAGKILVYKFSMNGYWCIDAGHCWDDPLES